MHEIKYEIGLNENGRPCIELPEDYEQKPEDKFFAIEIARYYLQMVEAGMDDSIYDENTFRVMGESIRLLGQLGDEMAIITYDGMRAQGEVAMMMNSIYHMEVTSIEQRDELPEKNIVHDNRIYDRVEGLKVGIKYYDEETFLPKLDIYELVDGITNENWVKI